jgi:hypothetical protein
MFLLAAYLILIGLAAILHLGFAHEGEVAAILAIAAGVLILIGR